MAIQLRYPSREWTNKLSHNTCSVGRQENRLGLGSIAPVLGTTHPTGFGTSQAQGRWWDARKSGNFPGGENVRCDQGRDWHIRWLGQVSPVVVPSESAGQAHYRTKASYCAMVCDAIREYVGKLGGGSVAGQRWSCLRCVWSRAWVVRTWCKRSIGWAHEATTGHDLRQLMKFEDSIVPSRRAMGCA